MRMRRIDVRIHTIVTETEQGLIGTVSDSPLYGMVVQGSTTEEISAQVQAAWQAYVQNGGAR